MKIYDLEFTNGQKCRYLSPEPEPTEEAELAALEAMFCGRLASMIRIIAPPPEKLPWKRTTETTWRLGKFTLTRLPGGDFHCQWPNHEVTGDKRAISDAVRPNYQHAT